MAGRIVYALVLGVALGVIVAGVIAYALARRDSAPAPARGELDAPYALALTVTEAFIAARINDPPPSPPGEPSAARPQLRGTVVRLLPDGTLQVRGETTVRGLTVPVRATLLPRVVGGQIEMAIIEGRAGVLAVPTGIAADLEGTINRQLRATATERAVEVVALEPGEGVLTIRLK